MSRGKPQLPNVLTVRVNDSMLDYLNLLAQSQDRDVAWIIRKAIEEYIEKYTPKDTKTQPKK